LFDALRKQRKFALRLGHVTKHADWQISNRLTKRLLKTRNWLHVLEASLEGDDLRPQSNVLTGSEKQELERLIADWRALGEADLTLDLRQKGVDMRIGLDITSITLKQQADTIVLVAGDSDFVPAAKLARREGVEFILDPMWQAISDDLHEHIDGLASVLGREKPDVHEDDANG
jgi:uncharacterized LabA/DUF88 family protein